MTVFGTPVIFFCRTFSALCNSCTTLICATDFNHPFSNLDRELEQQVKDLREVCKSSAATRTSSSASASPASNTAASPAAASMMMSPPPAMPDLSSIIPPLPAAAQAIVQGDSPSSAASTNSALSSFIKTQSMAPNCIYSPKKSPNANQTTEY